MLARVVTRETNATRSHVFVESALHYIIQEHFNSCIHELDASAYY
jgi:hypothetical protein